MVKFDRRRKYYMVLDCETATLPMASDYDENAKGKIAIAKPLIYDIGWQIVDRNGNVYKKANYLISEIFSVPSVFNTAYYKEKRPIYIDLLAKGEIELVSWQTAIADLENDLAVVESVGAYNSMFDFKKAIPFTELYIDRLYSNHYYEWLDIQQKSCNSIARGDRYNTPKEFDPENFSFRGKTYPLFDLWGMSCNHLLNNDEYRTKCAENGWTTASGKYYKTSAETTFRFIMGEDDFIESHTALDDSIIESQIFAQIFKKTKGKFEMGITYFPFRILGRADV